MRGHGLVYGGGRVGLMGVLALAVLRCKGQVVGIIPESLAGEEIALQEATELIVVETMHQRKALMASKADCFVAMPGGFGTCDELFEILTWSQLGIHVKPIALFNVNRFFDPLLEWLDRMVSDGFLKPRYRERLQVADTLDELWRLLGV